MFAGKDVSCALAKKSFRDEDINGDVSKLTPEQYIFMLEWERKFEIDRKYPVVGVLIN